MTPREHLSAIRSALYAVKSEDDITTLRQAIQDAAALAMTDNDGADLSVGEWELLLLLYAANDLSDIGYGLSREGIAKILGREYEADAASLTRRGFVEGFPVH